MGTEVPAQPDEVRSEDPYIGGSLHDLNTAVASPLGDLEGISDVDRDAVTDDSLDGGEDGAISGDCLQGSYKHSIAVAGVDEDRCAVDSHGCSSRFPCGNLTIDDVMPIETARARFLEIFVDTFIEKHVIEVENCEVEYDTGNEKLNKRKHTDVQYEGDPRFVLPLMYVANLYETLVNEVNLRLTSLDGIREKTIGVALEAAGGLYRKLAKKFPRKGSCSFKRRELATSLETRTRFPELVVHEEKRVRFVVVNGLEIIEKPSSMAHSDSEWFKRLTGRDDVNISGRDYKYYSPRHKYRRVATSSSPNTSILPHNQLQQSSKHHMQLLPHQSEYHPLHQAHQSMQQNQHISQYPHMHQCQHGANLPDISSSNQQQIVSQNMIRERSLAGGHMRGRLHLMPTGPAKFCDQCGTPYLRETSKFCSECGAKRLGI